MKPRQAIGITINGNEIRAAFLSLVRGKACIQALESTKLDSPLESVQQAENNHVSINDLEKAFNIEDPQFNDEDEQDESSEKSLSNSNVSLLYSLIDKFQNIKTNVAINTPVLTVKYDFLDSNTLPKDKNIKKRIKDKIDIWGHDDENSHHTRYLNVSDGKVLQIDYEHHPPLIDLIEEVNQFRAGTLHLVLMDTNELALIDLVKEIYKLKKNEITAIIYIEQDFSRVIFLKGREVYYITPIIHKGSVSKDVLEVIYSRIIFAQDQHFIPEIHKLLVAGHSSKLKAKYYFRQKFPYAVTGYLNSKKIQSRLRFKDRGLLFSRYAIPIALAWKALQKKVVSSKNTNFLPEYILERQRMPKLAFHGYILLLLLAITAFSSTWLLIAKKAEIKRVTNKINIMQSQIASNKSLTDKVKSFDTQISDLEKKIALVDSFSQGYEETVKLLKLVNDSVSKTGDIWITTFKKQNKRIAIDGMAKRREKIPILAQTLGGANLKKVTRSELHDTRVFSFQLEKMMGDTLRSNNTSIFSILPNSNHTSGK